MYAESDPALMLWTAALARWADLMVVSERARILELGCAETNWLERIAAQNPDFQLFGLDTRDDGRGSSERVTIERGDACVDADRYSSESFDAIVLLGALEHFGLGFYGDPTHDDGDRLTMQNVSNWLKPGGWVYFDVPCQPYYHGFGSGGPYITANRHFRVYTPGSIERLIVPGLREEGRAYSLPEPHAGSWIEEPTEGRVPYHYVAVLAEKVAVAA